MQGERAVIRYAKAFLAKAGEIHVVNEILADARELSQVISINEDLALVLKSPVFSPNNKVKLLKAVLPKLHTLTVDLLRLLAENRRLYLLELIANKVLKLNDDKQGLKTVEITTVSHLTQDLQAKILEKIAPLVKSKNVTVSAKTDADILGGFLVNIEGVEYDATLRSKISMLKRELTK